jgi:hypothetical protein
MIQRVFALSGSIGLSTEGILFGGTIFKGIFIEPKGQITRFVTPSYREFHYANGCEFLWYSVSGRWVSVQG